jgi:hypothetical protein
MEDSPLAEFAMESSTAEDGMESFMEESTSKSEDDFLQEDFRTSADTLDFDALELEEISTDPRGIPGGKLGTTTAENLSQLPEPEDKGHIRDIVAAPEKNFLQEAKPKNTSRKR